MDVAGDLNKALLPGGGGVYTGLSGDARFRVGSAGGEGMNVPVDASLNFGFLVIFPPIGFTADRALSGCLLMPLDTTLSQSPIGTSHDFNPGDLQFSSRTSHSSLSASAVLFIVLDLTGMQKLELISNSCPKVSSTRRHLGLPCDRFLSGPNTPS